MVAELVHSFQVVHCCSAICIKCGVFVVDTFDWPSWLLELLLAFDEFGGLFITAFVHFFPLEDVQATLHDG